MNSLDLVRIIGSHDIERKRNNNLYTDENLLELFPLSTKNKIPLLYLESVKRLCENFDKFKKSYIALKERQEAILFLMKKIGNSLSKHDINYAIFKTLKPFPFIASDIDLLFFTHEGLKKALKTFTESGYKLIGPKFRNLTMFDLESGIKIDLYSEVTVSGIVYMDKRQIEEHVAETTINNTQVLVPTPEADLLLTMGHSFYKEQLYTLADFYAISQRLTQFTPKQRNTFTKLAKAQHIEYACSLLLELTQMIHSIVFRTKNGEIAEILGKLHLNSLLNAAKHRTLKYFGKKIRLPYKYNHTTIAIGLVDKLFEDESTRHSVPYQAKELLSNPQFLKGFIDQLVIHITRETY
jgi:hypothetical protein